MPSSASVSIPGKATNSSSNKYKLNFPLLADTDGQIADAYGVRIPDRDMARRVSFLIGLDGKIAHVTADPSAETHLREMNEAVAKLAKK